MIAAQSFRQFEFRKKVTEAILETLAELPEIQRNIFIWNHYCGYKTKQIAEILSTNLSEIEATLYAINSFLYRRIRSLLEKASQSDAKMDLPAVIFPGTEISVRQSDLKSATTTTGCSTAFGVS